MIYDIEWMLAAVTHFVVCHFFRQSTKFTAPRVGAHYSPSSSVNRDKKNKIIFLQKQITIKYNKTREHIFPATFKGEGN